MTKSLNLPTGTHAGDLARCVTREIDDSWPVTLEIVAYWRADRRGKRRSIEISADEFFGRKGYGAPMSGEALILKVNQLRSK